MWLPGQEARLEEVSLEIARQYPRIKDMSAHERKNYQKLITEGEDLMIKRRTHEKVKKWVTSHPRPNGA